jgi:hypothetical protein
MTTITIEHQIYALCQALDEVESQLAPFSQASLSTLDVSTVSTRSPYTRMSCIVILAFACSSPF